MLGPTLPGTIVSLTPIGPEHLQNYVRWFADPLVTRFLARDLPPSLKEEEAWFDAVVSSPTEVLWGLFAEDQHIGSIGLHQIDWRNRRASTGTLIGDRTWWGRGVGGEAMRLRTRYAFEELGLEKLITNVVAGNTASQRALQRVGYQTVGTYRRHEYRRGQWWDTWIGELLKEDWLQQPG